MVLRILSKCKTRKSRGIAPLLFINSNKEEQKHKRVLSDLLDRMWNELMDKEKGAIVHGDSNGRG